MIFEMVYYYSINVLIESFKKNDFVTPDNNLLRKN